MGYKKYQDIEFVYEYDFDVDGGDVGTIALRPLSNAMVSGLVVEDVQAYVETAFDDAGNTATVTLGPGGGDADGFFADIMTLAETVDTFIRVGEVAGALLWDDTNDHRDGHVLADAAEAVPTLTVGTEALTQGKAKFIFKCRRF